MNKIKILYVIATLDIGGTERQLVELAKGVAGDGYEPVVCCLTRGGPLENELKQAGIRVFILGKKSKRDLSIIFKLAKVIRREKPVIVQTFLWTSNTWGRIAAVLTGVPVIISGERSVDLWKGWFEFFTDRMLALFTKKIIVNAGAVKKFLESKGISGSKIEVIYNGINMPLYENRRNIAEIRASLGLDAGKPVVGFIGRLCNEKDPVLFAGIAAEILGKKKGAQFLIIGDGELRNETESELKMLGIKEDVKMLGYRMDVPEILCAVDVVVLTSKWEGLPNVLMEAGAAAKPAVSFDVGGVREVIVDGETGFMMPPSDRAGFIEKTLMLLEDPVLARSMGEKAKQHIRGKFEMSAMIRSTEKIYQEVLECD